MVTCMFPIGTETSVYTLEGRQVGVTTYREISHTDGLAMDTTGNLLIADHGQDHSNGKQVCNRC